MSFEITIVDVNEAKKMNAKKTITSRQGLFHFILTMSLYDAICNGQLPNWKRKGNAKCHEISSWHTLVSRLPCQQPFWHSLTVSQS